MITDLEIMFLTEANLAKFVEITGRDYGDLASELENAEAHGKQIMMTIQLQKVRKLK